MKNKVVAVGGGRNNGKTLITLQQLTEELKAEKDKLQTLAKQYNKNVEAHNKLVDAHDGLLSFLKLQCGILYTAITGDIHVDDPLKTISVVTANSSANNDLIEYRKGLCIFVYQYEETGDPVKAFEAYQNFLGGI